MIPHPEAYESTLDALAARVAVMDRAWVLRGLQELFEMAMGLRCVGYAKERNSDFTT